MGGLKTNQIFALTLLQFHNQETAALDTDARPVTSHILPSHPHTMYNECFSSEQNLLRQNMCSNGQRRQKGRGRKE